MKAALLALLLTGCVWTMDELTRLVKEAVRQGFEAGKKAAKGDV